MYMIRFLTPFSQPNLYDTYGTCNGLPVIDIHLEQAPLSRHISEYLLNHPTSPGFRMVKPQSLVGTLYRVLGTVPT